MLRPHPSTLGRDYPGLAGIAANDGLASLQRLLVSDCPHVGDRGLRAVLDGISALRELYAGGCHAVCMLPKNECSQTFPLQDKKKYGVF